MYGGAHPDDLRRLYRAPEALRGTLLQCIGSLKSDCEGVVLTNARCLKSNHHPNF